MSVSTSATSDHVRSASIDVVRAVAALMVLFGHSALLAGDAAPTSGVPLTLGKALGTGVTLFFSLSAFLIAGPYIRALLDRTNMPPSGRYAVRRVARILPAYWVAFAVVLFVSSYAVINGWKQVVAHALLVHSLVPGQSRAIYFVAWTLGLEAIFYVAVPVGAAIVRRRLRGKALGVDAAAVVVLVAWGLSVVAGLGLMAYGLREDVATTLLDVAFGMGAFCPGLLVVLAETPQAMNRKGPWAAYRAVVRRPALALSIAGGLWLAHTVYVHQARLNVFSSQWVVSIASGLVVGVVLNHGARLRHVFPVLAPLGLVSYGIYLWHWVIIVFFKNNDLAVISSPSYAAWLIHMVVLATLTIPVAAVSWLVIERPLLRRTTSWDRRRDDRLPARVVDTGEERAGSSAYPG